MASRVAMTCAMATVLLASGWGPDPDGPPVVVERYISVRSLPDGRLEIAGADVVKLWGPPDAEIEIEGHAFRHATLMLDRSRTWGLTLEQVERAGDWFELFVEMNPTWGPTWRYQSVVAEFAEPICILPTDVPYDFEAFTLTREQLGPNQTRDAVCVSVGGPADIAGRPRDGEGGTGTPDGNSRGVADLLRALDWYHDGLIDSDRLLSFLATWFDDAGD